MTLASVCLLGVMGWAQGAAQPAEGAAQPSETHLTAENMAAPDEMPDWLLKSVELGLARLAREQQADGSFGAGRYGGNVAVTALAGIAFMADGNLPGRGPYGEHVRKSLEYVLSRQAENGLFVAEASQSPMYGHGFVTLFIAEVYGMTAGGGDTVLARRTHEALVRAVRLIEQSQNSEGGWRYNPVPYDADVSVTICQVMALRSARNAGIEVRKEVIDRAVEYVKRCQNPDGGFRYQAEAGTSLWARSAAGVATLYYAGIYEDDSITRGLRYVRDQSLPGRVPPQRAHYHYGHYYAVQAMYLAGGGSWAEWWPAIRNEMVASQSPDGGWEDRSYGTAYATSMCLIVLQMPKRYLPIFQR
ncbi:MAG: terpene cyclase/mutase family protein [Phycisphaeraceae bacterium]|nr:terpene cyclase/mutase family protein [Phycisphaeraceae bacterium]MCW5754168.1 terpene cyclase/mutase family protein [Phycisphaeraceae bacterium]